MIAFSVGLYNTLIWLHILGAVLWVGTGLFFQIHTTRLHRAGDMATLTRFAQDIQLYGVRLFTPASLDVLVMGILMVLYSPAINFTDAWILLGLVG